MKNKLQHLLHQVDIRLTNEQIDLLISYVEMLVKWNKAYNLTSVRDPSEMLIKHIMDSLAILPYLQGIQFIDVGTGPGLPGVPLAIARPDCQFTLVDSLGKRIRFLKQVKFELNIANINPVQSRIEQFTDKLFDGVISRAFASLQDMLIWCGHLPNSTGHFYALKGTINTDEINHLPAGFIIESTIELSVPGLNGERHLVIAKKMIN